MQRGSGVVASKHAPLMGIGGVVVVLLVLGCGTKRYLREEQRAVQQEVQVEQRALDGSKQLRAVLEELTVEWWGCPPRVDSLEGIPPGGGYRIRLEQSSSEDQERQIEERSTREERGSDASSLRTEEHKRAGVSSGLLWLVIGFGLCMMVMIGVALRRSSVK